MAKELLGGLEINRIYQRDCLSDGGMALIPDKSIDMILCDLPYGTTACIWDTILPFDKLWEQYERIIKDRGVIVLFGSQPFTSQLINSNINKFKYSMVWNKKKAGNILLAKKQPMKIHEDICVFYNDLTDAKHSTEQYSELRLYFKKIFDDIGLTKQDIVEKIGQSADHCFRFNSSQWHLPTRETYGKIQRVFGLSLLPYDEIKKEYDEITKQFGEIKYFPQMEKREKIKRSKNYGIGEAMGGGIMPSDKVYEYTHTYPTSILEFSNASQKGKFHPTQKPVALFEYLIKTYTREGEIVLDNCMGSGTTAVAALNTKRRFIGFETEPQYIEIANKRIEGADDLSE